MLIFINKSYLSQIKFKSYKKDCYYYNKNILYHHVGVLIIKCIILVLAS